MQTIQQLLFDAVTYEESLLAHAVFSAVQDGIVSLEDPTSKLDFGKLDFEKVQRLTAENMLAMSQVKLYAAHLEPGCFAFFLANTEEEATAEFWRKYNQAPRKMLDMWMEMDRSLYFQDKDKHMSFRQIKNQVQTFPYFVCEFQKTPSSHVAG